MLLRPLEPYFQFTVQHQSLEDCSNVPFCDLIVCGGRETRAELRVRQLTRTIAIESLVDAFIQGNESLICIENVYPLVGVESVRNVDEDEKGLHEAEDVQMNPIAMADSMADASKPFSLAITMADASKPFPLANASKPTTVLTEQSTTPSSSPVILQPFPPSLLRPSQPPATATKTKFIKCHPLTRQPHSIPLLYGPHQLQSTAAPITAGAGGTGRKRVLVRDEWLAEDDFGKGIRIGVSSNVGNTASAVKSTTINALTSSVSTVNTSITASTTTTPSTTTVPSTTTTQSTPSTTASNTQTTSKFQSSFFQNLQKKT